MSSTAWCSIWSRRGRCAFEARASRTRTRPRLRCAGSRARRAQDRPVRAGWTAAVEVFDLLADPGEALSIAVAGEDPLVWLDAEMERTHRPARGTAELVGLDHDRPGHRGATPRPRLRELRPDGRPMRADSRLRADLALVLVAVFWGVTFPLIRGAMEQLTPVQFVGWRFTLAALAFLPLVLGSRAAGGRCRVSSGRGCCWA